MQNVSDSSQELDWLSRSLSERGLFFPRLPCNFRSYLVIFHSLWIDPEFVNSSVTWEECSGENILFETGFAPDNAMLRTTWKHACEVLRIPFDGHKTRLWSSKKSWPRFLIGPDKSLTEDEVSAIHTHLTAERLCFFNYDVLSCSILGIEKQNVLYVGHLTELELITDDMGGSPAYWWPQDRTWLIYTDYDQCLSYVCCSQNVANSILADNRLETLRLYPPWLKAI